ncbi:MAG: transglutaminase N-terminal domain-containing protein [Terrimicrobiaceae bacterium]
MSRIKIVHTTTYRYAEPVAFGIHRLVVRPREGHDVQVENFRDGISQSIIEGIGILVQTKESVESWATSFWGTRFPDTSVLGGSSLYRYFISW